MCGGVGESALLSGKVDDEWLRWYDSTEIARDGKSDGMDDVERRSSVVVAMVL